MVRTIIYLVLFILAIIFLFQNGGQPVTLTFLKWTTPESIPVGFVFIGALLFGAIVVWLWHLPQIILLKGKVKSLNKRITKLMEDIKRNENEIERLRKEKEELEAKIKELQKEEKPSEESEEVKEEEEEKKEDKKKRGFLGIFKSKENEEKTD